MKEITSQELFNEVIQSEMPVVVKFGAPWCGPCKTIEPYLEQASEEGLDVYSVNLDNLPDLAVEYKIMSMPTTISFVGGKELVRRLGPMNLAGIISLLEKKENKNE